MRKTTTPTTNPIREWDRCLCRCLRMGSFLVGRGRALPEDEWERLFGVYQAELRRLRLLSDALRPVIAPSGWGQPDRVAAEAAELFGA